MPAIHHLAEDHPKLPPNELARRGPEYGAPQRDAINSVVDNLVADLCGKITELRHTLDQIEQRVLESAAATKANLQGHILTCVRFNDEIAHVRSTVDRIAEQRD